MAKQHLVKGMKVKILEKGEVIDEANIRRLGTGKHSLMDEIEIESLKLHAGETIEFVFIPSREGWCMVFEDPMAGGRCFSQRGPTYTFEPA